MDPEQFAAYFERCVPEYAQDKVKSGQWSPAESLDLSRQGLNELLPQGLSTEDNFLFTLRSEATHAVVGMLWYAIQVRGGEPVAYVYDVFVEPPYRSNGYGARAFELLEVEAERQGLSGIALHVFGHNEGARRLYVKLGYKATNINMFKRLLSAGT